MAFTIATVTNGGKSSSSCVFVCCSRAALASITTWYQFPADVATLLNMILTYEGRVFNSMEKNCVQIQSYGRFLKYAIQLLGLCGSAFIQTFGVLVVIAKAGKPPFLGSIIPGT